MNVVDFEVWRDERRSILAPCDEAVEKQHVRDAAQKLIAAYGEGWAGRIAGLVARQSAVSEDERRTWSRIEADIEALVGFGWFWPQDNMDAAS